ncbi:hypothetical protein RRU01S_03_03510 [Agrobacterium rubi TR3 = NBRC 13261]|uniref:Uncharacterized protein n=1 Tax=Agrobacterium rubi TR3 = NBRC 13261 TaxID=1368415 RepID=A0A081CR82_9HYPH|nr:hypothetical protein [Agrobacterium rubi]MBP1877015.1 hypothetical protein [Agrobacterium rubi]MCL6651200.1 hypothetical protein [Agrobacterium rubi]GAK69178.1 hypothetical protein RRU01S_03_03510 [Agrobacterium rubi TR3 = NBRC 13261]
MQQLSSLILVFVTLTILSAGFITGAASDGHWGVGIGALFIGPLVFFFVAHTVLYLGAWIFKGRDGVASYTASKINRVSALMTILAAIAVA